LIRHSTLIPRDLSEIKIMSFFIILIFSNIHLHGIYSSMITKM
jgi:hypothetical protein